MQHIGTSGSACVLCRPLTSEYTEPAREQRAGAVPVASVSASVLIRSMMRY